MSAINQQSMAQIAHPVFMMSQFVDISKLGLNSRIKKFGYSFICRKDYSHPLRGGIASCLQSDIMFFETNDRSARFGYDSAMLKSNYAMLTLVDLHTFSGIFDALADYQQVRTGMPPALLSCLPHCKEGKSLPWTVPQTQWHDYGHPRLRLTLPTAERVVFSHHLVVALAGRPMKKKTGSA